MSSRLVRLVAMVAVTAGLATPAWELDHLTVHMPFYPQGPQAYLFVVQANGWFRDAGLDVEILDGRGSAYSVQVLSGGHADIAEGEPTPLLSARQRGIDIKAVAEWFPGVGAAIIVPRDSAIRTPADLRGKRAGIVAFGPWTPLLPSFLGQTQVKMFRTLRGDADDPQEADRLAVGGGLAGSGGIREARADSPGRSAADRFLQQ